MATNPPAGCLVILFFISVMALLPPVKDTCLIQIFEEAGKTYV